MAFDLIPPPAFDFLPRDALRRVTKSLISFNLKAIKQYILGFNSVKLCCSNYILPFGTAKSVKSSKIFFFLFFKLLIFFPISKPFDFIPPPHRGGRMLNFIHPWLDSIYITILNYIFLLSSPSGYMLDHFWRDLTLMKQICAFTFGAFMLFVSNSGQAQNHAQLESSKLA